MDKQLSQEVVERAGSRESTSKQEAPFGANPVATSDREEDLIIASLAALAPSVATITGNDCEVVVHDLRVPERSIVKLVNGHVSGRLAGGPLIGGPMNDIALSVLSRRKNPDPHLLSYTTTTADGRTLRSTTTLFYNANGSPFAGFCLNHDLSRPLAAVKWLDGIVGGELGSGHGEDTTHATTTDFSTVLDALIEECITKEPEPAEALDRDARMRIMVDLESRGAFLMRGAVVKVAAALGVSRFTIYGYLDQIRST